MRIERAGRVLLRTRCDRPQIGGMSFSLNEAAMECPLTTVLPTQGITPRGLAMCKQGRGKGGWILRYARMLHRDVPTVPTDPQQFHRTELISRGLRAALARVSRPTRAEIEADKYEGRVPVLQWLGRGARKYN